MLVHYGWDCSPNRFARVYEDGTAHFCNYWGHFKKFEGISIEEAKAWIDQQRLTVESDRAKHRQALGLTQ
jgi:hypothetical protein